MPVSPLGAEDVAVGEMRAGPERIEARSQAGPPADPTGGAKGGRVGAAVLEVRAHPEDMPDFDVGEAVVLVGLRKEPGLNGQVGRVSGWGGPGERYEVKLQGGRGVKVHEENLELVVCGGSEMNWEHFHWET